MTLRLITLDIKILCIEYQCPECTFLWLHWGSLCWESLSWMPLSRVSLSWVSLCSVTLCWSSLFAEIHMLNNKHYSECHMLKAIIPDVFMLSVIMLSVIMLIVTASRFKLKLQFLHLIAFSLRVLFSPLYFERNCTCQINLPPAENSHRNENLTQKSRK